VGSTGINRSATVKSGRGGRSLAAACADTVARGATARVRRGE
jgi:hypothetical protein